MCRVLDVRPEQRLMRICGETGKSRFMVRDVGIKWGARRQNRDGVDEMKFAVSDTIHEVALQCR